MDCIFCKIVAGQIPARKVYEDSDIFAFHDIKPAAPIHFLIIPKKHIPTLADATDEDTPIMGKMMVMAGGLAKQEGCQDGFRTIINTGRVGCQEVYHVHMHVLGGKSPLGAMLGIQTE
jgi:histidine triad (HIT) family protein